MVFLIMKTKEQKVRYIFRKMQEKSVTLEQLQKTEKPTPEKLHYLRKTAHLPEIKLMQNQLYILRKMQERGVTLKDLQKAEYIRQELLEEIPQYDFLCLVDGEKVRLPFKEAKDKPKIGIFPQESSNVYIELTEEEIPRKEADESKIPTREYFNSVLLAHWEKMNKSLLLLGFQPLGGAYYATSPDYIREANWIVGLTHGVKHCGDDFYEHKELAKCRYVGVFDGR